MNVFLNPLRDHFSGDLIIGINQQPVCVRTFQVFQLLPSILWLPSSLSDVLLELQLEIIVFLNPLPNDFSRDLFIGINQQPICFRMFQEFGFCLVMYWL